MKTFHVSDYPRFKQAVQKRGFDRVMIYSQDFKQFLKQEFDIDAEVYSGDRLGQFWLNQEQAVWFVLKWS